MHHPRVLSIRFKTIEKKRSLNRVKSLRLLEEIALENKKAIKQSQNDINNQISRAKENLERKKEFLEKLQKVGDFILEIETRECSETPYYYKDNNGKSQDELTVRSLFRYIL